MRDWPSLTIRFPEGRPDTLTDLVAASFDPEAVAAVEECSDGEWLVSFRDAGARDTAARALRDTWGHQGVHVDTSDVSDGDWARRSQASLGAIRAGRLLITPPWLAPDTNDTPDTLRIVIEPSMGFGSGHHATTRLCLTALQALPVKGASVLDIGTGSGILAIAAALLGAADVRGIDNDPDALESARADAAMNGISAGLTFAEDDFRRTTLPQADIVLANLTGSMLAANVEALTRCVADGGYLVLSGITTAEADMVISAFSGTCHIDWRGDEDGWVGLRARSKK
jgi:ribosomal protein L11 methyltransferase